MSKNSPHNERIKREYFAYLKEAKLAEGFTIKANSPANKGNLHYRSLPVTTFITTVFASIPRSSFPFSGNSALAITSQYSSFVPPRSNEKNR